MEFQQGQKVKALVRVSFNLTQWLDAVFICEEQIGVKRNGETVMGYRVKCSDGAVRYAEKCVEAD